MITPEELRKLANAHLSETPPYVKHLYEACNALRHAADEIERLQAALKSHDARAEGAFNEAMRFRLRCQEELVEEPLRAELQHALAAIADFRDFIQYVDHHGDFRNGVTDGDRLHIDEGNVRYGARRSEALATLEAWAACIRPSDLSPEGEK
jgi:hypothetical protein